MRDELNAEGAEIVRKLTGRMMRELFERIPIDNEYSKFNIAMNVLTNGLVIMMEAVYEENKEKYISLLNENLLENLKEQRRLKQEQEDV